MATKKKKVVVADVVRYGDAIVLPDGMEYEDAITVLIQKQQEENTFTDFKATVPASPYDGALALSKALERKFGVATAKSSFWERATRFAIPIDAIGNTVQVPWGKFSVPNIDGTIQTSYTVDDGRIVFEIAATIRNKHKTIFDEIVSLTKAIVLSESIYRGKALNIKFTDPANGQILPMPDIKFIDVTQAYRPIFKQVLEEQLDMDVLAYITHHQDLKRMQGGVLKRGVLFAGPYGTGKTLTANYIARIAEEHGFTFLYVSPRDIPRAIDFAKTYAPSVVFSEDLESIATSERTQDVNNLLSKLDGVDSKRDDIVFIATTNNIDKINSAMMRAGRIDVTLVVDPPDAEAAIRLARHYANDKMSDEDFTAAGNLLAGNIPADIRESVKRAQVRAFVRTGFQDETIRPVDLIGAANSRIREMNLANTRDEITDPVTKFAREMGGSMGSTLGTTLGGTLGEAIQGIVEDTRYMLQDREPAALLAAESSLRETLDEHSNNSATG